MSGYDVIVLGGGGARGSTVLRRWLRVAVVERELVGGQCSYRACIPSKSLLRPGEAVQGARGRRERADRRSGRAGLADFMASGYPGAGQADGRADGEPHQAAA